MAPPLLSTLIARDLSVSFGAATVLDGVSLTVAPATASASSPPTARASRPC